MNDIFLTRMEKAYLIDSIYMAVMQGDYYSEVEDKVIHNFGGDYMSDNDVVQLLKKLGASQDMIDKIDSL